MKIEFLIPLIIMFILPNWFIGQLVLPRARYALIMYNYGCMWKDLNLRNKFFFHVLYPIKVYAMFISDETVEVEFNVFGVYFFHDNRSDTYHDFVKNHIGAGTTAYGALFAFPLFLFNSTVLRLLVIAIAIIVFVVFACSLVLFNLVTLTKKYCNFQMKFALDDKLNKDYLQAKKCLNNVHSNKLI